MRAAPITPVVLSVGDENAAKVAIFFGILHAGGKIAS